MTDRVWRASGADLQRRTAESGSLTDLAYERIRDAIRKGEFLAGQRLRYAELQAYCGTSVTPIREALTRLTLEGFTQAKDRYGHTVAPLTLEELWDITRNRQILEERALRLTIENAGVEWEAELLSSHHRLTRFQRMRSDQETVVDDDWELRHEDFHRTLISGCGSPILLTICTNLYRRMDLYRRISISLDSRDAAKEHRLICESALNRDAGAAVAHLMEHFELTALGYSAFFERQEKK